jgi:hypothetical protein
VRQFIFYWPRPVQRAELSRGPTVAAETETRVAATAPRPRPRRDAQRQHVRSDLYAAPDPYADPDPTGPSNLATPSINVDQAAQAEPEHGHLRRTTEQNPDQAQISDKPYRAMRQDRTGARAVQLIAIDRKRCRSSAVPLPGYPDQIVNKDMYPSGGAAKAPPPRGLTA